MKKMGFDNELYVKLQTETIKERNTAPSATRRKTNQQKKNRESTFSKPSLYALPPVYSSKKKRLSY